MARWSFTKLRAARTCPQQFHFVHVERSDDLMAPGPHLEAGRQNHALIEQSIRRSILADVPTTPPAVESELRALLEKYPKADPKVLDAFLDKWEQIPVPVNDEEAVLEARFYCDEGGFRAERGDEAFFGGVVDYVVMGSERLEVWDWKTGWGKGSPDDEDQVIAYAGMILLRWRAEGRADPAIVRCVIFRPLRPYASALLELTADEAVRRFQAILAECRSLDWMIDAATAPDQYTVGDHCAACPARGGCPAYQRILYAQEFGDPAEAWAARAALKDRIKRIEEYLQAELKASGQFALPDGRVVRHVEQEIWSFPGSLVWPMLKAHAGVSETDFLGIVSVSKTELTKLKQVKRSPDLLAMLKAESGRCGMRRQMKALWPSQGGAEEGDDE